jgi:hypothetical protein
MNPDDKIDIIPPKKGEKTTKKAYKATIVSKMQEMMNNRGRRRG